MRKWMAVLLLAIALPLGAEPSAKQRELAGQLLALIDTAGLEMLDERDRGVLAPAAVREAVRNVLVEIYAGRFTESELAELIAFYGTATGKKLARLSPELIRESAEKSRAVLAPLIARERDRLSPWVGTIAKMRYIGEALEKFAIENGEYPQVSFSALERMLVPNLMDELPKTDAWGHEFYYVTSRYGRHYRLVSAGSDGAFERGSQEIPDDGDQFEEPVLTSDLKFDLIYANGSFMQLPRIAAVPE